MNNLSWLLYLSDVLPKLSIGIGVISVLSGIIFGIATLILWCIYFDDDDYVSIKVPITLSCLLVFTMFFGLASNLIPSRQTILLIAASKMSEQVVKSQDGQEIMNNLKQILKELTTPKKEN